MGPVQKDRAVANGFTYRDSRSIGEFERAPGSVGTINLTTKRNRSPRQRAQEQQAGRIHPGPARADGQEPSIRDLQQVGNQV